MFEVLAFPAERDRNIRPMNRLKHDEIHQVLEALGLGSNHREAAQRLFDRIHVDQRQGEIYAAGNDARHLFVLLQEPGATRPRVRLATVIPSRTDPVTVMWVRDKCFGEDEFVGRHHDGKVTARIHSCIAPETIRCAEIPYARLLELDPGLLSLVERKLARQVVMRSATLVERFGAAKVTSKAAQLAQHILEMAEDVGIREGGGRRIDMKLTQQELAHEVGLTREAVNARLGEWRHAGLMRLTPSHLKIIDEHRFQTLVLEGQGSSHEAHAGFVANIDDMMDAGDNFRARNLALDALAHFPRSAELLYRAFLAAMRTGSLGEAQRLHDQVYKGVTDKHKLRDRLVDALQSGIQAKWSRGQVPDDEDADAEAEFQRDLPNRLQKLYEDVLVMPARLLKERALGSHRTADRRLVSKAAEAYEDAWRTTHGYFPAINAATLHRIAGNQERATEIARQTRQDLRRNDGSYWALATIGEAELLLGNIDAAREAFSKALATENAQGRVAPTRLQLRRLAPALNMTEAEILGLLPQGAVIVFSGHLTRKPEDLPQGRAKELRQGIIKVLENANAAMAYGALGAGGDALFADALLQRRVPLNVVLPFQPEDFIKLSITGRIAPEDAPKFAAQMEKATSLRILADESHDRMRVNEQDERFLHANRHMLGLALLKADELVAPVRLCTMWDGNPATSIAGTAHLIDLARQLGVEVDVVDCPWRPRDRSMKPARLPEGVLYTPVVFVWEQLGTRGKEARKPYMSRAAADWPPSAWTEIFPKGTPGVAVSAHVFDHVEGALERTADLMARASRSGANIRVVCDLGPVRMDRRRINLQRLKRLPGADDGLQMPWGEVAASEAFAAEARLSANAGVKSWPAGRVMVKERSDDPRPVSSIPMYHLQW